MRAKDYGVKKYLVETFVTERHVVTVYADTEDVAVGKVRKAYRRTEKGVMAVSLDNGVYRVHADEDYDYKLSFGETQEEEEDDVEVHNRSSD